jgi:predicted permease
MTPPLFASLLSLLIACFPPVQQGIKEYMSPLTSALSAAGRCSIPLTLLVLGAYFCDEAPSVDELENDERNKAKRERGESRTVAIAVLSRMLVTPVLLMPVVWFSVKHSSQRLFEE